MKPISRLLLSAVFVLLVMVAHAQMYILNEDFSTATGATPPANWQNNTIAGEANAKWHFDNPGSRTINFPVTAPFAILDAPQVSPDTAAEVVALESPYFDASVGSYCLLFFDHFFQADTGAKGKLMAFNGAAWVEVTTFTATSATNPTHEIIDLTAICAGKTNAKLRFQWEGHGKGYWAIDNVRIYAPLLLDAGISAVDSPAMPFNAGVHEVKVTLNNFGYQPLTAATIKWSVNGVLQAPFTWTGNLSFGAALPQLAIGTFNFQPTTNNVLKVWSESPNGGTDMNHINDTTVKAMPSSLCGTYTIGGVSPDFATLNEAVVFLNSSGITCPVVFRLRDGIYNERIELNKVTGSSAVNTITFESESGDSSLVTITSPGSNGSPGIYINGAEHVIVRKLGVQFGDYAIKISNFSKDIEISNCKLPAWSEKIKIENNSSEIVVKNNSFWDGSYGVLANNSGTINVIGNKFTGESSTYFTDCQNLTIDHNEFIGNNINVVTGISVNYCPRVLIINNRMSNIYRGIQLYTTNSFPPDTVRILSNEIYNVKRGIEFYHGYSSGSCIINGNRITNVQETGINAINRYNDPYNTLISNNYIHVEGVNAAYGIRLESENSNAVKRIINNSINITNTNPQSGAIYVLPGTNHLEIKNNIFSNPGGGYAAYLQSLPASSSWDFNDYHSISGKLGFCADTTYSSLTEWRDLTGGEAGGLSVHPFYTSATNLQPNHIALNNSGTPIPEIGYDIDSTMRNPVTPDIGAREFSPCMPDLGIDGVSYPVNPIQSGLQPVRVIIRNQGLSTIAACTVYWQVSGQPQQPFGWTGSLTSGQYEEVTLGNYIFPSHGYSNIQAWVKMADTMSDCNPYNDTVSSQPLAVSLCGIYTIGGVSPDFATLNEAVNFLNSSGITCPVVFRLRDGIYNERIELNKVTGSSAVNTITFESESGDSSLVTITSSVSTGSPGMYINGSENIIIRKLGFYFNDNAIKISNSSKDIEICNCNFSTWSEKISIESNSSGIVVKNNSFWHSGYGVQAINCGTISVIGNKFTGETSTYFYFCQNLTIDHNEFIGNNINNNVGISSWYCQRLLIINNRISNLSGGINLYSANSYSPDTVPILNNEISDVKRGIEFSHNNSSGNCIINGNRITNVQETGINVINTSTDPYNTLISNNYIHVKGVNAAYGIRLESVYSYAVKRVINNSINITNTNPQSGAIYVVSGTSNLEIKNNIFSNPGGGYAAYLQSLPASSSWDFNDYHSISGKLGFCADITYSSLTEWRDLIGGETGGLSVNPFYSSATNLHPNHIALNNTGTPFPEIGYDIDSTLRNPVTPDIGAREFSPCMPDLGLDGVSYPVNPIQSGLQPVRVVIRNQGLSTMAACSVYWQVSGQPQQPFGWTGSLTSGQYEEVTLGSYIFPSHGYSNIKAWVKMVDTVSDCNPYNDTVSSQPLAVSLCGTYTIGGVSPDFATLNEAVVFLNSSGITCPVVFRLRDGIYNERIELNKVTGSSAVNTITFESESGDSSLVTITSPGSTGSPGIYINGAEHVIVRKLGFYFNDNAIKISNSSKDIEISNCKLPAWSEKIKIENNSSEIVVKNNSFWDGSYGVLANNSGTINVIGNKFTGESSTYFTDCQNLTIDHNEFIGNNINVVTGISVNYCPRVLIINNRMSNIFSGITLYNWSNYPPDTVQILSNEIYNVKRGIEFYHGYSSGSCIINGNRITNVQETGINAINRYNDPYNTLISNNYIHVEGVNAAYGIRLESENSNAVKRIINNSINITNTNPQSGAIYVVSGTSNLEIKNNIFSNPGGGYAAYLQSLPANSSWDFNNYHTPTNKIGYLNGTTYNTFSSWSTAISGEANGKNLNPYFAADTSYKTYQRGLNGAGIPVTGVPFDIEGKIRNNQAPDMGCWEFMVDFGITQVLSPTLDCYHATGDSLTILLRQYGDVPFTNIRLAYTVNNGPVKYDTITGTVSNDIVYTFHDLVNISATGTYAIKCWMVGNIDDNVNNDTILVFRHSYPSPVVDFSFANPCAGEGTQFTATASVVPPYTMAGYEWMFGDGDTAMVQNPLHAFTHTGIYPVRLRAFSNKGCYTEKIQQVPIHPVLPVNITISTLADTVCAATELTFTATATNAGVNPAYQWKVNGVPAGQNLPTLTIVPANHDAITCLLTPDVICPSADPAISNTVTISVKPLDTVNIAITSSANPVCAGTVVSFTATVANGGETPAYQWKVNGVPAGGNSPAFSCTPLNGDAVTCTLTSSAECPQANPVQSAPVIMEVIPTTPVSISILASDNPACPSTLVTYTATAVNGGTEPVYQWKVNGSTVGGNSPQYSYTPQNGDQVKCILTSNALCMTGSPANSNVITMSIENQIPAGVAITASANPVCSSVPVTLTASPVNGGTAPVYQWKRNGIIVGGSGPTYSFLATEGDSVRCVMTSNSICATGNPATSNRIVMHTIPALPVSVSISSTATSICAGTSVTFTATPVNGGTNPVYQWKVNGSNVGTNSPVYTYNPMPNHKVTCVLTSNVGCASGNPATSNQISMVVFPLYQVKVTISTPSTSICAGTSATFTATPTNGGSVPVYQWKVNGTNTGTNSSTFSYIPANNDKITCTLTSNINCVTSNPATSNQLTMTVSPNVQVSVSITSSPQGAVCAGTAVSFIATPVNGGTLPGYLWKVNGNNASNANNPGGQVFSYVPVNGDVVTCELTSSALCATGNPAVSNALVMAVNPVLPVSVSVTASQNPFCTGSLVTFNAAAVNGGGNPVYQWRVNGNNVYNANNAGGQVFSYLPVSGDVVTCVLTSDAVCASGNPATSNAVVMSAFTISPTVTGAATACLGGINSTFTTQANMTNYQWNVSDGGQIIGGSGTNTITVLWNSAGAKTISVTYGNSVGCMAQNPGIMNLTVYDVPGAAGVISGPTEVCTGTLGVVYSVTTIPNATSYQWRVPLGVTIVSGSGTRSVTVNFPGSSMAGDFSVKGTNTCYNGASSPVLSVSANAQLTGQVSLTNITIPPAHQECLAAQSITTAGAGTSFVVESGGEVTLIASQYIRMLPGTVAASGAYLRGFITTQCIPCNSLKIAVPDNMLLVDKQTDKAIDQSNPGLKLLVYPNPTAGEFTLEFKGELLPENAQVSIYDARGELIFSKTLTSGRKHALSLSDRPLGIYFLRVNANGKADGVKLIKF